MAGRVGRIREAEGGSVTPLVVVGMGMLTVSALFLAGLERVVDAQIHLAALAEQVALTQAQQLLSGGRACRGVVLPNPYFVDRCDGSESEVVVDLSQVLALGFLDLKVSARGRYLING